MSCLIEQDNVAQNAAGTPEAETDDTPTFMPANV
jgi:hypothetical protein